MRAKELENKIYSRKTLGQVDFNKIEVGTKVGVAAIRFIKSRAYCPIKVEKGLKDLQSKMEEYDIVYSTIVFKEPKTKELVASCHDGLQIIHWTFFDKFYIFAE